MNLKIRKGAIHYINSKYSSINFIATIYILKNWNGCTVFYVVDEWRRLQYRGLRNGGRFIRKDNDIGDKDVCDQEDAGQNRDNGCSGRCIYK